MNVKIEEASIQKLEAQFDELNKAFKTMLVQLMENDQHRIAGDMMMNHIETQRVTHALGMAKGFNIGRGNR